MGAIAIIAYENDTFLSSFFLPPENLENLEKFSTLPF